MASELPHKTATAFAAALTDRLVAAAAASPYSVQKLRRQFSYDRLLTRIFATAPQRWVLKGGGGLLARIPGQARHSMDIDLFYRGELETAVLELQDLGVDAEFGDFFTFDIERTPGQLATGTTGTGLSVVAYVGDGEFQRFSIDLVVVSNMTQEPDVIEALTPVPIQGLPTAMYRVYPIVDHVADKHAAMIDTYGNGQPSSRHRDLVDLVLIATTQQLDAHELRVALLSEYAHRNLDVPARVELPDPSWVAGYAREAAKVVGLSQQTASEGLAVAQQLLEPVLQGLVTGTWDPESQYWD